MKKPELLAPGGSFLSSYYAFEAGADGVYLGMKEFSARAGAQNFSVEQLRRIRQRAAERQKRVYVAVNTVVLQKELPRLSETLAWLEALGVDGVIVQDLGVCDMIARRFPRLTIHASTQMALHNDAGLAMARDLGIRRVILPRELPLARIRALRERHPDMELEVFIHGALCYSFSGICLASSALTGRSGNRGDCAQICRSSFGLRGARGHGSHLFSCNDLFLGREVLRLAEAGVDALKIEGRMKSPEYVYNATRLYRAILDRGEELPEGEYADLVRRVRLSFSRRGTTAWLDSSSGADLIDTMYPGHRGSSLGRVGAVHGREIGVRLAEDLSVRDGVGYFTDNPSAPVVFSAGRIRKNAREVRCARTGEEVRIELPPAAGDRLPGKGVELRHLSSRFLDLPQPREAGFPLSRMGIEIRAALDAAGNLSLQAADMPGFRRHLTCRRAEKRRPFAAILAGILSESGDSLFAPNRIDFENQSGYGADEIFVPPSQLKKVKNELYAFLDATFLSRLGTREDRVPRGTPPPVDSPLDPADTAWLKDRRLISPPAFDPVPFVDADPGRLDLEGLVLRAGCVWLPLPPVILDDGGWSAAIRRAARDAAVRGAGLAVGLNNLSHLGFAKTLACEENAYLFVDFALYAANGRTLALLREILPRLFFAYSWIEGGDEDRRLLEAAAGGLPVVGISGGFRPPLFCSLGCFARHVLNRGECFDDCPKDFTRALSQGSNSFTVVVRDCITWLFAADP